MIALSIIYGVCLLFTWGFYLTAAGDEEGLGFDGVMAGVLWPAFWLMLLGTLVAGGVNERK